MALLLMTLSASAKKKEQVLNEKGEIIKTGYNYGPLPCIAFDADRGFQFGALLNLYNYGDGSLYPNTKSDWYFEVSAYTKEKKVPSYKAVVEYDNKNIGGGVRMSVNTGYYKDAGQSWWGLNGYNSYMNYDFLDKKLADGSANPDYMPGFYRFDRDWIKVKVDFQGEILPHFSWLAGYSFQWFKFTEFGQGQIKTDYELPATLMGLYNKWGIISDRDLKGGIASALRVGLRYDTRDVEKSPTKGIWADINFVAAPKFIGTTNDFYKFGATFRHYVPLYKDKLVFAYRAAIEGFMNNDVPWYMLGFYTNMGSNSDREGFGGYNTTRGLKLARVQGLIDAFYNIELRWRFVDFKLWNQNIAFGLSVFTDGVTVVKPYNTSLVNADNKVFNTIKDGSPVAFDYDTYVKGQNWDGLHASAGAGLRFIMNRNFIVAFEYGRCFKVQDGKGSFYINLGYLF